MRHDPERLAAAFLAGELGDRKGQQFQAHLLECDQCWHEVQAGRQGRLLAESLREVAPPDLRERIRTLAASTPAPHPTGRWSVQWPGFPPRMLIIAIATALVAVLAVVTVSVVRHGSDQPGPIAEALAAFREPTSMGQVSADPPPARTLGGLTWTATTRGDLDGVAATLYLYTGPAGERLLLIHSTQRIPTAGGAERTSPTTPSWTATIDGATLLCADRPGASWLAIGTDRNQVLQAGHTLGLR